MVNWWFSVDGGLLSYETVLKRILPEIPGKVNHQLVIDRLRFGVFL